MKGSIFLICADSNRSARISRWILEWIEASGADLESNVYLVDSIALARESLSAPLEDGVPPALVVIDRATAGSPDFASLVADCIPETWVVEILSDRDLVPRHDSVMGIREGARKDEWESILHHCVQECPSPQWSRTLD